MRNGNDRTRRIRLGGRAVTAWMPVAGVAAAAMVLAAGCGGSTNAANAGHTTAAGASGTSSPAAGGTQAPTAAIQAALAMETTGNDKTVTISGTIAAAGGTSQISGQEEFAPDFGVSMNLASAGSTVSEVLIGDTIYLKVPQDSSQLDPGKSWFELDVSDLGPFGSVFSSMIDSAKNTDPAQLLESMLAANDLTAVGTQTINGVQTTHYSGTVDPATAYDSAAAKQYLTPTQIQQLKSLASLMGTSTEKMDVWIAADGLPAQIEIADTLTTGTFTVTEEFTKWGQPVDITAPPASEVQNMGSIMSGLPTSS